MFKIGDKVRMNGKYILQEAHRGKVWTVLSEPRNACGMMVVTLDGLPGYAVDGLELVERAKKGRDS